LNQDFRGKGSSLGNVFGFYKTRHILLSDSANCAVLRAVVLTQYRRVTDRRTDRGTDGIAVASTALAMRALRRAVTVKRGQPTLLFGNSPNSGKYTVFQKVDHQTHGGNSVDLNQFSKFFHY